MRFIARIVVPVTVAIVLLGALPRPADAGGWVRGVVGYSSYAMSDVNNSLDGLNAAVDPLKLEDLKGGLLYGAQIGFHPSTRTSLYAAYERLNGSSSDANELIKIEIRVPANCFVAGVEYSFPSSSSTQFGLGGAAGVISTSTQVQLEVTTDWKGSGFLGQGYLFASIRPGGNQFFIVPQIGYRFANVADVKVADFQTGIDIDYSGLLARLALQLEFAQ